MKKDLILNTLRLFFIIIIGILLVIVCLNPKNTETNILKAVLSDSQTDNELITISQRHAGRFNVIFKSKDIENLENAKREFEKTIISSNFQQDFSKTPDLREVINTYLFYSANLLSGDTAKLIRHNDYEAVKFEALERLYNPMSINFLPIEEDPFMLFTDYLQSLSTGANKGLIEKDDYFYEILQMNLNEQAALSPTVLNEEIKKLIKIKSKIEQDSPDIQIYLCGSPIHTYYASSKSIKEINIICILSTLFIILLCKFYFKTFKLLIPIATSLLIGILSGWLLTNLIFKSIHILTFVFSTTLIGICVDYSLHFFAHDYDIKTVFKSLTISMFTTVSAFLILLFSNIELLNQIAIFTATGLFSVYLFVVLFYPVIFKVYGNNLPQKPDLSEIFDFKFSQKIKNIIVITSIILSTIGLTQIKFNDSIKDMYRPPKFLAESEKLFSDLSGNSINTIFLTVKGSDLQNILENEEEITKSLPSNNFAALSKFVPSVKQQKANKELRKKLYKNALNSYATFLDTKAKIKLIKTEPRKGFLTFEQLPLPALKDFFVDQNTSVIILRNTDSDNIAQLIANNPNTNLIDLTKDISEKIAKCRHNCLSLILPVIGILFILLSFIYKPKNAIKIISPSVLGGLFTIGMLGIFQIEANLFHILALFLIVGFSLDYSIFRFNNSKNSIASESAVLISCATSVFSFLLLAMTSFKLISSLGFILSLGLTSSYIFSLLLISTKDESEYTHTESM